VFISFGQIAQSVEQRTENPCVAGSIPVLATLSLAGEKRKSNGVWKSNLKSPKQIIKVFFEDRFGVSVFR
jgi:hypothetical protein